MANKFSVSISGDLRACLNKFEAQVGLSYQRFITNFVVELNDRLLAKTPVWEGETIRNWRWSMGAPNLEAATPAEGEGIDPGHTNDMAIGAEPRYAMNAAAQREEMEAFLAELAMNPGPVDIYLTNTSSAAVLMEAGQAPDPNRSRAPQGVLFLSLIETLTVIGAR